MSNWLRVVIIIAVIIAIASGILLVYFWEDNNSDFTGESEFDMAKTFYYDGKEYKLRDDVDTILITGVDKLEREQDSGAYYNDQHADFIVLLVVDHKKEACYTVPINRDTMTRVNVLGVGGKKIDTVTEQVALAQSYGSGSNDSCRNTARAVANIFGGMKIDNYLSLTMNAVPILNDLLGGVTVKIKEDLTAIDPAFIEGSTVTLTGEQALSFVRGRQGVGDGTNISRMERQSQYMDGLYAELVSYVTEEGHTGGSIATELAPYMTSNCSTSELEVLMDSIKLYKNGGSFTISGESKKGEFMEFYPDENSLKGLLAELFYEPK